MGVWPLARLVGRWGLLLLALEVGSCNMAMWTHSRALCHCPLWCVCGVPEVGVCTSFVLSRGSVILWQSGLLPWWDRHGIIAVPQPFQLHSMTSSLSRSLTHAYSHIYNWRMYGCCCPYALFLCVLVSLVFFPPPHLYLSGVSNSYYNKIQIMQQES